MFHSFLNRIRYFWLLHMDHIGRITGIHGLKGEVTFSHHLKRGTKFTQWDCLMVELNPGSFIPFFIETINSLSPEECICKLEEINNRDEAKLVLNKLIYTSVNYSVESVRTESIHQYIGFKVVDADVDIGEIVNAVEAKMNSMFVIDHHGKEIMVPSQQELIERIDRKGKIIHMNIPDGLLDL